MTIRDYIRDEIFAKRVGQAGCLMVYDPARRYGELVRALDSQKCRVLDATTSVIEQREAAMTGLQALASGELEGIVMWCPSAPPLTDDELQGDPFSVLARLGARFPAGDG